jgi:hypothetical protein
MKKELRTEKFDEFHQPFDYCNDSSIQLVKDEICGNIYIYDNTTQVIVLWESEQLRAFGTVSIFLAKGADRLETFINNRYAFSVISNQTRSITVPLLKKLEVRCGGDNTINHCIGKYCIHLHYTSPFQSCEDDE